MDKQADLSQVNLEMGKILEIEKKIANILDENNLMLAVEPIYKVFLRPKVNIEQKK